MSEGADFGTVTIVGVGLLGGSIGKALLRENYARRVIGVGRSPERLAQALSLGAISEFSDSIEAASAISNIVILCTPVSQIIADLPLVLSSASAQTTVTDVGSVKSVICAAAGGDPRFVGSHPMAGSEQTGVIASRSNLFQEAVWALTPLEGTDPQSVAHVKKLAQSLGAATLTLTPERHDQAVAITSHLPHALATSLMRLADSRSSVAPEVQRLTAGSFADGTRVAASSPDLWRDIFHYNRAALIDVITAYRAEIDGFLADLEDQDAEKLRERFASGSDAKRSWSEQK